MSKPNLVLVEFANPDLPYHESYSPFCMKVHRALRYAGLDYSSQNDGNPAAAKALNPKGQLPVLLVDGTPLADSTPILRAIERMSPLAAKSTPEARLWEEFADSALYGYLVASRWADDANWVRTREAYFTAIPRPIRGLVTSRIRKRVISSLIGRDVWRGGADECWTRLRDVLADLEVRAPRSGYWLGDELTVADLAIFPQLHGYRTPLTPVQREWLESKPTLVAYLDRVDAATRVARTSLTVAA